jgi:hypothetical protein
MVENGIKPIYVFDGKPPQLKSGVVSMPRLLLRAQLTMALDSLPNDTRSETRPKKRKRKLKRLVCARIYFDLRYTADLSCRCQVPLRTWKDKSDDKFASPKSTRRKSSDCSSSWVSHTTMHVSF